MTDSTVHRLLVVSSIFFIILSPTHQTSAHRGILDSRKLDNLISSDLGIEGFKFSNSFVEFGKSETQIATTNQINQLNITDYQANKTVFWGTSNEYLSWTVNGGEEWELFRNGSIIETGSNESSISLLINWQKDQWNLGMFNLTLVLYGEIPDFTLKVTTYLKVEIILGDDFVDKIVAAQSIFYTNPGNILGPPDGKYTSVFPDYEGGFITLDMGIHQEIIDGEGFDFNIIATGGEYLVSIENSLTQNFHELGGSQGNSSFDISDSGFSKVRYIRIEYVVGEDIFLDAIISMYRDDLETDDSPPTIHNSEDLNFSSKIGTTQLTWIIDELTPWNYSIYENDTLMFESYWDGDEIKYSFTWNDFGVYLIQIHVYDLYGNLAVNYLFISIETIVSSASEGIQTSSVHSVSSAGDFSSSSETVFGNLIILSIVLLLPLTIKRKRKRKSSFNK